MIGVDVSERMLEVARALAEASGRRGSSTSAWATSASRRSTSAVAARRSARSARSSTVRAGQARGAAGGPRAAPLQAGSSSSTSSPRARDDIAATDGRWLEREPGIFERADWDERDRTLVLSVRGDGAEATMSLHWLSELEWRRLLDKAGFDVSELYGWFDRRPFDGGEDMIWVCRRRG